MIKPTLVTAILAGGLFAGLVPTAHAHCEIPCGIYTDSMRIDMIEEHCQTIEKSMAQIRAGADGNQNQLIRWVTNKEDHANQIQHIVTQYFMTQRIKPEMEKYEQKLSLLHQMLLAAMKCKQTTEPAHVAKLRVLAATFSTLYFGPPESSHQADPHAGHSH
jgi:nickel superoxide dismutase